MRKILIPLALASTLFLGGCWPLGNLTVGDINTYVEKIVTWLGKAQDVAATGCQFSPDVVALWKIWTNDPTQTADAVAAAVCQAVASLGAPTDLKGDCPVKVQGVCVPGRKVE